MLVLYVEGRRIKRTLVLHAEGKPGDFSLLPFNLFRPLPGAFAPLRHGRINSGTPRVQRLLYGLHDDIVCCGRCAPRVHLRQRAHGGESHIDYALDTFPERFVGAGDGLEEKGE